MASEDDAALLLLIFQHLKVNGYQKAAKVLQKHVAQVETSEESSSLHDIYTSWIKLCSLAQQAKQETEDLTTVKKNNIKPEPATSEEEEGEGGADTKLSNVTEENNVDAKPLPESGTDGVESSTAELPCEEADADTASEPLLLHPAEETTTTKSDSEEEEKEEEEEQKEDEEATEQESAPVEVSAEASNEAESSSSDSEEEVEPGPAASDEAEDQLVAPDASSDSSQERKEDDDELTQATDETPACEQTAVNQDEVSEEEDGSAAESVTNDQPAESEAPPPAGKEQPMRRLIPGLFFTCKGS
ncbi:uncharacterized protein LOC142955965 [Anarhichas minor]|uniref:uncharacterized protein LOC142955965 n=1 Tax=Anarhichas minor TaxID=65739 RepID=UPI003F7358B3